LGGTHSGSLRRNIPYVVARGCSIMAFRSTPVAFGHGAAFSSRPPQVGVNQAGNQSKNDRAGK